MDATKLRIGNVINCNKNFAKGFHVVSKDTFAQVEDDEENKTNLFTRILLTNDVLLKNCNFIQYKGWDDQYYWLLIKDKDNPNRFELLETDNGFLLTSDEKIEFLDQLQNCYYFHSLKEELIVNL